MGFTKKIKDEAMKKAGYRCCVCGLASASVEVHHIIPQEEGGDDLIENAVALCPTHHAEYGANSEKRTRIKEIRNWWYGRVSDMYSRNMVNPEQLNKIYKSLQFIAEKQGSIDVKQNSIVETQKKHDTDLENLKVQLKIFSSNIIDKMTPATSDITTSAILGTAALSQSSFKIGEVLCQRCNRTVDSKYNVCPYCGFSLYHYTAGPPFTIQ